MLVFNNSISDHKLRRNLIEVSIFRYSNWPFSEVLKGLKALSLKLLLKNNNKIWRTIKVLCQLSSWGFFLPCKISFSLKLVWRGTFKLKVQRQNDLVANYKQGAHQVVFWSRDDPLAASDRKVGEDAVFLVLVSAVRLQTFALAVVPQLQGVVKGGCQDVLAVGRELDEGHGRVVIVDQGLETLAWKKIKDI